MYRCEDSGVRPVLLSQCLTFRNCVSDKFLLTFWKEAGISDKTFIGKKFGAELCSLPCFYSIYSDWSYEVRVNLLVFS